VAGQTAAFPFGSASTDDYRLQPINSAPGDAALVTPVATAFSQVPGFATNFPNLVCAPYLDYRSDGPQCVELQLDCIGTDSCNFLYTAQLDYGIDGNTDAAPNLVGAPAFLVQHDVPCLTAGFTDNIFLSYTGSTPGTDPPLRGGGTGGHSCYVSAFDPTAPGIPAGTTVSTFPGFEFPSNTKVNPIIAGLPVPLLWAFNDNSGNPVTNLHFCKAVNANGTCATTGVVAPWVHLSLTALTSTAACQAVATPNLPSVFNSGLLNLKKGQYSFIWDTSTKIKGLKGCQVRVVLQFNTGGASAPALFQYAL